MRARSHSALKLGSLTKTPAMQAGLVSRKLTFGDIFTWSVTNSLFVLVLLDYWAPSSRMEVVARAA